jgi:PAS domain S-box-containing protein
MMRSENKIQREHIKMNKQTSKVKISVFLAALAVLISTLAVVIVIYLVNVNMRQQALAEAESKALILLNRNLATHSYYSQILKPHLFEWTEPFRAEEYFEPSWMSSTYAVREIDGYFKELSPSDYYIKDAAINARSPNNEADEYERAFLEELNADPTVQDRAAVRTIDGRRYLTVLRRGEVMDETCMRCHSTPDNAPDDLVRIYGPERSFNRHIGETISTVSIHIPLEEAYAEADRISVQLSVVLLCLLGALFAVQFWVYRRVLLNPVTLLQDKASQIINDEKHLGEQIQLPFGRELAELTTSFNLMSSNLRQSRDHLEMRVRERTLELENANRQLKQEIVERKQAEERLQFQSHLLNAAGQAIIATDPAGMVIYMNRFAEKLYGWSAADTLNKNIMEVTVPDISQRQAAEIMAKLQAGESWSGEFLVKRRDGTAFPAIVTDTPIYDQSGGLAAVIGISQDITERKRAEEEIRQLNATLEQRVKERTQELLDAQEKLVRNEKLAVLGQMAGSVGHELRNPLAVISNSIYFLKMIQTDAPDKVKEYLDRIEKQVRISDKIVGDLLDFTRVKSVARESVSIPDLIRQTLERFPAPENIQVEIDVPADLPKAYADPQHVIQVLGNLTLNACQAMKDGGRLIITSRIQNEMIRIAVQDTGTGISPENMKKLFEPLFTTKPKGIGLGLAVCQKLIEANGGRIEVESEVGVGSMFTVYLPAYKN